jgi:hypothetical protein
LHKNWDAPNEPEKRENVILYKITHHNLMLNQPQIVTLHAFLTALVELVSPLPQQLQQEMNKVGEMFTTTPTVAINQLTKLAEHDFLKELYWQARINIQQQYEVKERNIFDKPNKQKQPTQIPPERIANIAIAILKAPNSSTEAKKHKSEIKPDNTANS